VGIDLGRVGTVDYSLQNELLLVQTNEQKNEVSLSLFGGEQSQ